MLALLLDEVIMNADSRVNDYISLLPDWQQAICQQVRQLVHDADPEVEETIKRSVLPYFVLQGNVAPCSQPRITSTSSSTTPPWPTHTASSTRDMATRQPGPCRSTVATRSINPHCWRYSKQSSRTTARAAGDASRHDPPEPGILARRLDEPLTEPRPVDIVRRRRQSRTPPCIGMGFVVMTPPDRRTPSRAG